ncbi:MULTISPECIES: hypothetical protein [unclassified Bradyrhizobium]|uniref:hypothetical protein n=1 Tax=unclassified Bradyrhizobium TaxID=2631580 RepID=UPI0028E6139E|nr:MULTISPECIES: hypothetical protein [unclassified Bradyrhizobium]
MRGEFLGSWSYLYSEVWYRLLRQRDAPDEMAGELFREINSVMVQPKSSNALGEILQSREAAEAALAGLLPSDFQSEVDVLDCLTNIASIIEDYGFLGLATRYAALLHTFIKQHQLRYRIAKPFRITARIEGVFDALIHELRIIGRSSPQLRELLEEFDRSFGEAGPPCTPHRVKICLQKNFNFAEGLLGAQLGVSGDTLGKMAKELHTWPHDKVREALVALYKFASDYPGIRHGGNAAHKLRDLGARDLVALPILLAGIAAYITAGLPHDRIYGGR